MVDAAYRASWFYFLGFRVNAPPLACRKSLDYRDRIGRSCVRCAGKP
jgi:hypothetical protein